MRAAVVLMLALSPAAIWQKVWRDTNSHAAAAHGAQQYSAKNYDGATKSFASADRLAPSPKNAFNLGTSQVAAGRTTEGSAALTRAMKDPALREESLFNRGNSALTSKAYEYAIRDYTEALKLRPDEAGAKRNLEIAIEKLNQMRRSAGGRQQQQQSPSPQQQQQQQKAPSEGGKEEEQQQGDTESLLRSVQQQEQEELQRMKRARADSTRVGW